MTSQDARGWCLAGVFPASPFHHLSLILIFGATGTSYMSEQKSVRGFHLGNGLAVLRKDPPCHGGPLTATPCLYGTPGSTEVSLMLGHTEILPCPLPHEG